MLNYFYSLPAYLCPCLLLLAHCSPSPSEYHTVPLQLRDQVPYASLSSFCLGSSTDSIGFQDALVLLDSGSNQFWLADSQCSQCSQTQSLCPQIFYSDKRIGYYSGQVHGSYSFLKVCQSRLKFFCVRGASEMDNLKGGGVLGIRKAQQQQNVGYSLLFGQNQRIVSIGRTPTPSKISSTQLQFKTATFHYGRYQNFLFLTTVSQSDLHRLRFFHTQNSLQSIHSAKNQPTVLTSRKDWTIQASSLSIIVDSRQETKKQYFQIQNNFTISFDSGSSEIVFPSSLCHSIIEDLKTKQSIYCSYISNARTGAGLYCNQNIHNFSIQFHLSGQKLFHIGGQFFIQDILNKISIICQDEPKQQLSHKKDKKEGDKNDQKIILGYPVFKAYQITLAASKQEGTNLVILNSYRQQIFQQEQKNLRVAIFLYAVTIGVLGWAAGLLLNYFQNKRQMKIII